MNTMRLGLKKRPTRLVIFLHDVFKRSASKKVASCMALLVRKNPIGASTTADIRVPMDASTEPSRASLVPEMSTTQYSTKNSTATITLVPRPPFLMSAPRGAPMKNSIRQASAWANFLYNSMSVLLRRALYSKVSVS